jgi:hypothetical protein
MSEDGEENSTPPRTRVTPRDRQVTKARAPQKFADGTESPIRLAPGGLSPNRASQRRKRRRRTPVGPDELTGGGSRDGGSGTLRRSARVRLERQVGCEPPSPGWTPGRITRRCYRAPRENPGAQPRGPRPPRMQETNDRWRR